MKSKILALMAVDPAQICFLIFAAGILASFPFSVEATPINLIDGATNGSVSVSGSLNGDFSGNVLTLNSSAPLSTLSIGVPAQTIPNVDFVLDSSNCSVCGIFNNLSIEVSFNPAPIIFPTWNFNLSGQIDFNSLTGSLTGSPQGAGTMFTTGETFTPTLTAIGCQLPDLGCPDNAALQAVLDAADPSVTYHASGTWTSDTLNLVGAALTTNQIDAQMVNVAAGSWNLDTLSFNFGSSSLLAGIETTIANDISTSMQGEIQSRVDALINASSATFGAGATAVTETCSANGQDFTCTDLMGYSAPFGSTAVPEPDNLVVLFGLGLLGVGLSRRRLAR